MSQRLCPNPRLAFKVGCVLEVLWNFDVTSGRGNRQTRPPPVRPTLLLPAERSAALDPFQPRANSSRARCSTRGAAAPGCNPVANVRATDFAHPAALRLAPCSQYLFLSLWPFFAIRSSSCRRKGPHLILSSQPTAGTLPGLGHRG